MQNDSCRLSMIGRRKKAIDKEHMKEFGGRFASEVSPRDRRGTSTAWLQSRSGLKRNLGKGMRQSRNH